MRRLLLTGLGWLVSLSALAQTTTDMTNTPPTQVQNAMGLTVTLPNYGAGTLDSVYNSFINAIGGINLSGYISGLFWALAGIALVWQLIQLMLRSGEIGDLFAGLVRWILFTGVAWMFVAPGGYVFQMMSVTMFGDVSQSMGEVTPSGIVDIGINILSKAYSAVKWNSPTTWANFGVAFAVFMMMLSVALEFLVMMIAANVYINVGVVTLGFAGSNWTKDFAFGYFKGIFIAALQILGLVVVVRIAQAMFVDISANLIYPDDVEPSPGMMWDACLQAFIIGLAMKLLSNRVPTMLAGILSGNFAYSSGNALGSAVTMAAGAGALAGGIATLGASGIANRFTGAAVKGLGSTLNGLAQSGSAMNSTLQSGGSLSSILSAGRSGFSSGFSEFSKAAGQSKDASAAGEPRSGGGSELRRQAGLRAPMALKELTLLLVLMLKPEVRLRKLPQYDPLRLMTLAHNRSLMLRQRCKAHRMWWPGLPPRLELMGCLIPMLRRAFQMVQVPKRPMSVFRRTVLGMLVLRRQPALHLKRLLPPLNPWQLKPFMRLGKGCIKPVSICLNTVLGRVLLMVWELLPEMR